MTQFKKSGLALICSALLLAGCNLSFEKGSSAPSGSEAPVLSSSEDIYDHTEIEPLSDISTNIAVGSSGYLGDISVGMSLATGSDYPIVFTLADNPSGTVKVYSDNNNVLTATSDDTGSNWTLHTHKAGAAHLIIEDGDHIIHFRRQVEIKPKLTLEEAKATVYTVDHWDTNPAFASYTGVMQLYFLKDGSAYINGQESGGVSFNNLRFGYEYAPTYENAAEDLEHWFIFQVTGWTEKALIATYFALWDAGDTIHLHTTQSLLGIFNPAEAE